LKEKREKGRRGKKVIYVLVSRMQKREGRGRGRGGRGVTVLSSLLHYYFPRDYITSSIS